jgi:membrane protein DedA with SNARE-associated domain
MPSIITLLETYKYLIYLPLAIVEGPIVSIIAGFLVTVGVFDMYLIYLFTILGDIIGDSILYILGRWGKPLKRWFGPFIGVTKERLAHAETYFKERHTRSLFLSKVVHGIGSAGLVAAGMFRVTYVRFVATCLTISLVQSAIFITIGMLFGKAYVQIGQYLNYYVAFASIAAISILIVLIYRSVRKASK